MSDDATRAILDTLAASHALTCAERVLMFDRSFDTSVITIRGASSAEHFVRLPEKRLCDLLNLIDSPISLSLVVRTLCDIYDRPGHYGVQKLRD